MQIAVSPDWRLSSSVFSVWRPPKILFSSIHGSSQRRGLSFPSTQPSWTLCLRIGTAWTRAPKRLVLRLDVILFLLWNQTKYLLLLGWVHWPYVSLLNCSLVEYMSTLWTRLGVDLALNTASKLIAVTLHIAAHFPVGPKLCRWTSRRISPLIFPVTPELWGFLHCPMFYRSRFLFVWSCLRGEFPLWVRDTFGFGSGMQMREQSQSWPVSPFKGLDIFV